MSRLRLLAASLARTPLPRVAARLRLLAKRKGLVLVARAVPIERLVHGRDGPRLRDDLPPPVFAPRTELAGGSAERPTARFLNLEVPVTPPIDWFRAPWRRGTRLELLNLHYMEWAEAREDGTFTAVVEDWIERVRPYAAGYWRDAWNSYALSIRCVVWMQQLAARRERLDPAFVRRCSESIVAQIRFLRGNLETDIRGNHIVRNVKALLWAGRAFEGPEAEAWRLAGERILQREIVDQVLPDGVHCERSPAYHAQVLADLLECASVLGAGALRDDLGPVLDAMATALSQLTHPDGRVALFNDGGLHMSYAPATVVRAHERAGGTIVEPTGRVVLAASGFYGSRSGDDLVLLKCGRIGDDALPAHAHGDVLSFEWTLRGRRIIVDPGVFEYHEGPMRAWSRSTAAHNTVTVADLDQAEFWGAFRVGRRPNVEASHAIAGHGLVVTGTHDGFRHLAGAPIHRRRLDAAPEAIAVFDSIEGGAGQPVRARLLLHPETSIERVDGGAILTCGAARARLTTRSPFTAVPSWWCPDFGVKLDTRQIVIDLGAAPCTGEFRLEKIPDAP